jgi:hypothetical protein
MVSSACHLDIYSTHDQNLGMMAAAAALQMFGQNPQSGPPQLSIDPARLIWCRLLVYFLIHQIRPVRYSQWPPPFVATKTHAIV